MSAATRPWQASDISKAPPMQVPLIAETHGLPQVSSLRHSQAHAAGGVEQKL
jgi:hypothetical protein